jgi:uncharacterized SAM-binding protein YcdF (DUF218 family)
MKQYQLIATLGSGFSDDWKLPSHVYPRLQKVADLYKQKVAPKIAVCGRWSINWDLENTVPPITEAQLMKEELIKQGVAEKDIYLEEYSKDTIGNAYFLKTKIINPKNITSILVVCPDFHLERIKFLFSKIYSDKYQIDFMPTKTQDVNDPVFMQLQKEILERQMDFLKNMRVGDDSFLKQRLYNDPYYLKKRPAAMSKAAMGDTK